MTDYAQTLADMAGRRIESLKAQERRDIAAHLLATNGSVTTAQVEEHLTATWIQPTDEQLADQVAAKCEAALDHERREANEAADAIGRLRDKVAKFEGLLVEVREQVADAEAQAVAAAGRVEYAEALVVAARQRGNPALAPAPTKAAAVAETATGTAEVS